MGRVICHDPAPGEMASGGSPVGIVVSLCVLYVTLPDVTATPPADAETVIYDAPMDLSVFPGVWIGLGETPPEVPFTYEPERVNVGNAVTFTVYTADNVGPISKSLTVKGRVSKNAVLRPFFCTRFLDPGGNMKNPNP